MHRAHPAHQLCPHSEVPQIFTSILLFFYYFLHPLYPICALYSLALLLYFPLALHIAPHPFPFSGSFILLALHFIFSVYPYRIGLYILFSLKLSLFSCSLPVYSHSSLSFLFSECIALFASSFSIWPHHLKQFLQVHLFFSFPPFPPLLDVIYYLLYTLYISHTVFVSRPSLFAQMIHAQ